MDKTKRKHVSSFFFEEIENSHVENSWYRTFDTYFVFEDGLSFRLKAKKKMSDKWLDKYASSSCTDSAISNRMGHWSNHACSSRLYRHTALESFWWKMSFRLKMKRT